MKKRILALVSASMIFASCSDSGPLETPDKEVCLMRRDGMRYCIDVYEASRRDAYAKACTRDAEMGCGPGKDTKSPPRSLEGKIPWPEVTWGEAKAACELKSKRLCEADEWIDACDGVVGAGGQRYTYGDTLDTTRCNVMSSGPVATGTIAGCKSPVNTHDQSGNLWEWTGNLRSTAAARGGGYRSDVVHECASTAMSGFDLDVPSPEVGFRCCRF
jgi:formylglycine-generating enzyme required for sulfatase activity